MPLVVTHTFVSAVADGADTTLVRPTNWNANHTLTGTLDVSQGGTGQTTEAEALGEMIQALTADASPDTGADYVVTYDASDDTGKKVLLSDLPSSGVTSPVPVADGGTGQTTEAEALGEMTQALTALSGDTADVDWDTDLLPLYDTSADTGKKATLYSLGVRDRLMPPRLQTPNYASSDQRDFYIRTPAVAVTLTNASPCVVTWTAHGLQNDDPVVFTKPWDARHAATVTIASPAVVSYTAHGYANNDPFKFNTNGALPTGITAGTTYYVINAATDTFQFSTTSGGSAVNTSGSQSGSHVLRRVSSLPSGVTEGTIYYVLTTPTTDTFTFSTVADGSAVNTSSAQAGRITAQTGNDNNDGTAADRAHAMLTVAIAWQKRMCGEIDTSSYNVYWNIADGVYDGAKYQTGFGTEGSSILIDAADATWTGGGSCNFLGNLNDRTAVRFINCNQIVYVGDVNLLGGQMVLRSVCIEETVQSPITMYGGQLVLNGVDFANTKTHIVARENSSIHLYGFYTIWPESTGTPTHCSIRRGAYCEFGWEPVTYGTVNFTHAFISNSTSSFDNVGGLIEIYPGFTLCPNITGRKFYMTQGSAIMAYGEPLSYIPGTTAGVIKNGAAIDGVAGFTHTLHNGMTFASLTAVPIAGMKAYVTDSNTATWGATVAGGGANKVMAWYNGTNWTVMGA